MTENGAIATMLAPVREGRPPSLLYQVFGTNAVLLVAVFAVLALTPLTVTSPLELWQGGALSLAVLALVLAINLWLMRRALEPLARLSAFMAKVRLVDDERRIPNYGNTAEIVALTDSFNRMLDRLRSERLDRARRIMAAQEDERLRVARDLHDEVGQRLTALMLELDHDARQSTGDAAERFARAREEARATLDEVRLIARRLRPEALDQLGLPGALSGLCRRFGSQTDLPIDCSIERALPRLDPEQEMAVYRIAQESLTNTVRHAGASRVELELSCGDGLLRLRVADDGRRSATLEGGTGVSGMRERAALIGAALEFRRAAIGGVEVVLEVPLAAAARGLAAAESFSG